MKAVVFFYDSYDINTGMFYSLEEALAEDFVRVKGNQIIPSDECSIVYWYDEHSGDSYLAQRYATMYIEYAIHQKFKNAPLPKL